MIPGMNPRMMKQAMKKMGIKQEELDAIQVIIRCQDSNIVVDNPQVSKVNMMGQDTVQVTGEISEAMHETKAEINKDDIKTVMDQCKVDEEKAREAIEAAEGDLAKAIMNLQG